MPVTLKEAFEQLSLLEKKHQVYLYLLDCLEKALSTDLSPPEIVIELNDHGQTVPEDVVLDVHLEISELVGKVQGAIDALNATPISDPGIFSALFDTESEDDSPETEEPDEP
jgi:hypothetical protein